MQESVIIFGCSVLIFLYILFYDLKYYKIPNWCSVFYIHLRFMYILVNDKQLHVVLLFNHFFFQYLP